MSEGNHIYDGPNMGEEEIDEQQRHDDEEDLIRLRPSICETCHEPYEDGLSCGCVTTPEISSLTHCNVCHSALESHGDCSNADCTTHLISTDL